MGARDRNSRVPARPEHGMAGYNQIQRAAEKRGHGNRTAKAALGGLLGGAIGSFVGPGGAALGAGLGAWVGASLGDGEDQP